MRGAGVYGGRGAGEGVGGGGARDMTGGGGIGMGSLNDCLHDCLLVQKKEKKKI